MSEAGVPSASALSKLGDKIKLQLEGENKSKKSSKKAAPKKDDSNKEAKKDFKKDSKKDFKKDFKKDVSDKKEAPKKDFKKDSKKGFKGDNKDKKDFRDNSAKKSDDGNDDEEDVLLREIKNFGGSAADLDLIEGISDAESVIDFSTDKGGKGDKALDSDIFKFMNDLGLKGSDKDFVIKDDDDEAQEPAPKAKKEKKDVKEEKKETKEPKKEKKEKKEADDKAESILKEKKKANKKETELEERKKQFNSSTANDIDQIVNEVGSLESGETVFNAQHTKNELIVPPHSDWYNVDSEAPAPIDTELSDFMIERLHTKAKNLLAKENELFTHENNKTNSQKQFLSQLLTAGTLSDKIGAYSLLIQESPLHSVKYFTSLMALCRKKSRGSALQSIASLKDIFVQGGVLPDRKLRWFKHQPGLSTFASPEWLIVWAFEDWLKQYFFSLVQILEVSACAFSFHSLYIVANIFRFCLTTQLHL